MRKAKGRRNGKSIVKKSVRESSKLVASERSADLSYRKMTPEDRSYIIQLTEEQLAPIHRQAFGEEFPREQFSQYLTSGAPTGIVERQGKRIGYYSYLAGHDGKMHISAMVIEPSQQQNGVGSAVMKHLEAEARAARLHTMEVFVQVNNEQSLEFTKKLGFVEAYRIPPNTVCYQKSVSSGA